MIPDTQKKILFAVIAAILALIFIELGVRLLFYLKGYGSLDARTHELEARISLKVYQGQDWAKDYYLTDLKNLESGIDPLVGWRPKEYYGKYVTIDSEGLRKTWNPPSASATSASVFMFGGSTMWGAGGRDDYTIPSIVSKILNSSASKSSYTVTNYGQSGYVLVQEIAKLVFLLEKGKKPDYVVFYDGANDVSYAYESGIVGPDGGAKLIQEQFQSRVDQDLWNVLGSDMKDFVKGSCATCRALFDFVRSFNPSFANPNRVAGQDFDEEKVSQFAKEIADYHKNKTISFLNDLAKSFRFKLITIWQPNVFLEKKLIGEESDLEKLDPRIKDSKVAMLHRKVNALLPSDPANNFYNLSDIFVARDHEYYIDYAHVSEEGNDLVAKKIAEIIKSK